MKDTSGPAFPRPASFNPNNGEGYWDQFGMTRRQWLAGLAMQAMMVDEKVWDDNRIAMLSHSLADAMLAFEESEK